MLSVVLLMSLIVFYFTKHNNIDNFTAKRFAKISQNNDLIILSEICYERTHVVEKIKLNQNKHFQNLVIGSSRVMQIGKNLGFKNTLNLAVPGAGFKDLVYIYDCICKHNISFDTVIFDYNPWLLLNSDDRYMQFNWKKNYMNVVNEILTFNYDKDDFLTILGCFNQYSSNFKTATQTEINTFDYFIKFTDGSIQQKSLSKEERTKEIDFFVQNFYQLKTFKFIDSKAFTNTIRFIDKLNSKGKCIVTLFPFHPLFLKVNKDDIRVKNIFTLEQMLKSKCKSTVLGSYQMENSNIYESDFYDGLHLYEKSVLKLFKPTNHSH